MVEAGVSAAMFTQELIDNQVKGIHFCTLNLAEATLKIFRNIRRG
jgi:methylenetetrahydrofolate reductase (NADPH)